MIVYSFEQFVDIEFGCIRMHSVSFLFHRNCYSTTLPTILIANRTERFQFSSYTNVDDVHMIFVMECCGNLNLTKLLVRMLRFWLLR